MKEHPRCCCQTLVEFKISFVLFLLLIKDLTNDIGFNFNQFISTFGQFPFSSDLYKMNGFLCICFVSILFTFPIKV